MNNVLKLKGKQTIQNKMVPGLATRINCANLMKRTENEFRDFVADMETSGIFKKLLHGDAVRVQIYHRPGRTAGHFGLKEEITPDITSPDMETFLEAREEAIRIVKKIGLEKFKRYFLDERCTSDSEIADQCGLASGEIKKIWALVNDLTIQDEFLRCTTPANSVVSRIYYRKIGTIIRGEKRRYIFNYLNTAVYNRRYIINHERIRELRKNKYFSSAEAVELGKAVCALELINIRKHVMQRILEDILKYQSRYLNSGNDLHLRPLTLRELGRRLKVSPSHICRIIRYKSVVAPWREEKPLRHFLPNKKKLVKEYIKEIVKDGVGSDRTIREMIERRLKVSVSRRSICDYRRELETAHS